MENFYEKLLIFYKNHPAASSLRLYNFPDTLQEFEKQHPNHQLEEFYTIIQENQQKIAQYENPSLNDDKPVFLACIYGPTTSGKTLLLKKIISQRMLNPQAENFIIVTPSTGTVTETELCTWKAHIFEGNFRPGHHSHISPTTPMLIPKIYTFTFNEITTPENLDFDHPDNIFNKIAAQGNTMIIYDDCMSMFVNKKNISMLFHTFPSKLASKHKCAIYSFVVLHNVYPRDGHGNNIQDLKIQSLCHIISTKCPSTQIERFVHTFTKTFPTKDCDTLLKGSIVHYSSQDHNFIVYNANKPDDLEWGLFHNNNNFYFLKIKSIMIVYFHCCKYINDLIKN